MKNEKARTVLTVGTCLATVALAIINTSHGSLLTPMTDAFLGGDGARQGDPNAAMQIGCFLSVALLLFVGKYLRGRRKQNAILAGLLVMGLGMLSLRWVGSFGLFTAVYAVVGVAFGLADVLNSSLVADLYGDKSASMMCVLHGSHGAAGILAPLVTAAVLARSVNWQTPYIWMGGCILLLFASVLVISRRFGVAAPTETAPETRENPFAPLREKGIPGRLIGVFFYGMYLVGMICWTERYECMAFDVPRALSLSVMYVGITAGRLGLPLLKLPSRKYLRWAPPLGGLALLCGLLAGNRVVWILAVGVSFLLSGAFVPVTISEVCTMLPGRTTLASTWVNLFMLAGNTIASTLIGAAAGAFGVRTAMFLPILAIGCVSVLAFTDRRGIDT